MATNKAANVVGTPEYFRVGNLTASDTPVVQQLVQETGRDLKLNNGCQLSDLSGPKSRGELAIMLHNGTTNVKGLFAGGRLIGLMQVCSEEDKPPAPDLSGQVNLVVSSSTPGYAQLALTRAALAAASNKYGQVTVNGMPRYFGPTPVNMARARKLVGL